MFESERVILKIAKQIIGTIFLRSRNVLQSLFRETLFPFLYYPFSTYYPALSRRVVGLLNEPLLPSAKQYFLLRNINGVEGERNTRERGKEESEQRHGLRAGSEGKYTKLLRGQIARRVSRLGEPMTRSTARRTQSSAPKA